MISAHEDTICGIAYLPGGERVVTCSADNTVKIWNTENGEQEGTSMKHDGKVLGLAITRDGKRILSGGSGKDQRIRVWDVETQECIEEWESGPGEILYIAISPDGQLAASGDRKGKVLIREMTEGDDVASAKTIPCLIRLQDGAASAKTIPRPVRPQDGVDEDGFFHDVHVQPVNEPKKRRQDKTCDVNGFFGPRPLCQVE
ncbi:WD40-repeat-containing domain protein [Melanogaster broomeanus]|nr:WD40-repeat-containing domain protein [Melanogaster broomeanus]